MPRPQHRSAKCQIHQHRRQDPRQASFRSFSHFPLFTLSSPAPASPPFWKTTLLGPFNYITDRYKFRINGDAFNALNIQGYVNPNPLDGIQQLNTSFWTPRQIQVSARFTFQ